MKLKKKAKRFRKKSREMRNAAVSVLRRERHSFGLEELDLRLLHFLPNSGGFFVECGANDGIAQSNTLYLEKYLGWEGLLIEAVPELAEKCRRNRRRTPVAQCALVSADFPDTSIEIRDCNLMSVVRGGRKSEEEEQDHLELGRQIQKLDGVRSIVVPARTMTSVLNEYGVTKIDLLSLDVEGYEAQVLGGLDLNRFRPDWIVVEANYKADIDACLRDKYEEIGFISALDVLYKSKELHP